jgi:hypothetical protein
MIVTHRLWCIETQQYRTMKFEIDFDIAKVPATAFYKAVRNKNGTSQIGSGAVIVRRIEGTSEQ